MKENSLLSSEFAALLGIHEHSLPENAQAFFDKIDTRFSPATPEDRDRLLLATLHNVANKRLPRSTENNLQAFVQGWSENLEKCKHEGVSPDTLRPAYVKPFATMRLNGQFVNPKNQFLFDDLCTTTMLAMFETYFADKEHIYEFGCGTGRYLWRLQSLYPQKHLVGFDWAAPSQEILSLMRQQTGCNIEGYKFNMLEPRQDIDIPAGAAFFTVGAMEQLGQNYKALLEYFLNCDPSIVIHHEPVAEMYDQSSLFDMTALLYHRHRGYLDGYLDALRDLEKKGRLQILQCSRMGYGDPFNEGSSLIIWRKT